MKKITYSAILFSTLVLASCSKSIEEKRKALKEEIQTHKSEIVTLEKSLSELGDDKEEEKLSVVYLDTLRFAEFASFVKVNGVVATDQNVMVMPETNGVLRSIRVRRGQRVSKGQAIASVDNSIMQKNLTELKSQLEFATTMFEKQERLFKQKVGTEVQYLQAKNSKESIENSIETLKTQISKSTILAPISGKVDEIFPKKGELVAPGTPIVRIVSTSNVYVDAEVSEAYISKVKRGDSVEVFFPFLKKG